MAFERGREARFERFHACAARRRRERCDEALAEAAKIREVELPAGELALQGEGTVRAGAEHGLVTMVQRGLAG